MRPDEHPELQAMGKGEPTCDFCIELFPLAADDVCNDCGLNPFTDDGSKRDFAEEAYVRAMELPLPTVKFRVALSELAGMDEEE